MGRGRESVTPHTGTETRTRLLREAAVRNIGQWSASSDPAIPRAVMTALWVVKLLLSGKNDPRIHP